MSMNGKELALLDHTGGGRPPTQDELTREIQLLEDTLTRSDQMRKQIEAAIDQLGKQQKRAEADLLNVDQQRGIVAGLLTRLRRQQIILDV